MCSLEPEEGPEIAASVEDLGWHEVAGYFSKPTFGQTYTYLLMNLDTFNGLDEQQQTTIILILTHFTVYVPEIPRGSARYQGISLAEIWTLKMCPWANCTLKEN